MAVEWAVWLLPVAENGPQRGRFVGWLEGPDGSTPDQAAAEARLAWPVLAAVIGDQARFICLPSRVNWDWKRARLERWKDHAWENERALVLDDERQRAVAARKARQGRLF